MKQPHLSPPEDGSNAVTVFSPSSKSSVTSYHVTGPVTKAGHVNVIAKFDTNSQAQKAVQSLNGSKYEGLAPSPTIRPHNNKPKPGLHAPRRPVSKPAIRKDRPGKQQTEIIEDNAAKKNVYVLNLPYDMTERHLESVFSKVGKILHVCILATLDANRRRRAFIDFSSSEEAKRAIEKFTDHTIKGFRLDVSYANYQRSPSGSHTRNITPATYEAQKANRSIDQGKPKKDINSKKINDANNYDNGDVDNDNYDHDGNETMERLNKPHLPPKKSRQNRDKDCRQENQEERVCFQTAQGPISLPLVNSLNTESNNALIDLVRARTLQVEDLPEFLNNHRSLSKLLSNFGEIEDCLLLTDVNGKPQNTGYVVFKTSAQAKEVHKFFQEEARTNGAFNYFKTSLPLLQSSSSSSPSFPPSHSNNNNNSSNNGNINYPNNFDPTNIAFNNTLFINENLASPEPLLPFNIRSPTPVPNVNIDRLSMWLQHI